MPPATNKKAPHGAGLSGGGWMGPGLRRGNATLGGGAAKLLRWLRGQDLNL